jgi:tetratricopeptide (TPR) repeat protein
VTSEEPPAAPNTISGGVQAGPVIQGRDITAAFHLPASAPVALDQLPAPVAGFTGREADLGVLAGLLDPAERAGTVVVSAVAGLAGVGKTALAVQAGHVAKARGGFPGGVLFVDLHGYDDQPVQPEQALDALLRALGVPGEHIPPTAEERAGLYRSALAAIGDPVLVIADNASSEAQVTPLLPGTGPHTVLVTSRHTLAGLGARLLDLTVLDDAEAVAMLAAAVRAARPADDRITADPAAAGRLAAACGGLPLALRITAALLNADPSLTAAELAGELGQEQERLARLAYGDGGGALSVAAAFELSVRRLDEGAARLFRLMAGAPGPDISTAAAAVLAGLPGGEARRLLAALGRAHLAEPAPGVAGRWRMHDLVRLYARQLSDTRASADGREEAVTRLLSWYLGTTYAADDHLRVPPGAAVPAQFAGREAALAWLDAERPALIAAVALAAATGRDQVAMGLPLCLAEYLGWRRRFDDWLAVTPIAVAAARRLGDRANEAIALTILGNALGEVRRFDEAIAAHQDAAAIFRQAGSRHREGMALNNLGLALQEARRFDEAISACQDAAAIFRQAGDRHGEGRALGNLGLALDELRRFDEAIAVHQDAGAIFRETGDRHDEARALGNLGVALLAVRRHEEAISACQAAGAIFRETGDRHGEGIALNGVCLTLHALRRFAEAISVGQDAAAIFRETGDRHGEGIALNNLGLALQAAGRRAGAISVWQAAAAIFGETGDQERENSARENLARIQAAPQA